MSPAKIGLGRGLGALIPTSAPSAAPSARPGESHDEVDLRDGAAGQAMPAPESFTGNIDTATAATDAVRLADPGGAHTVASGLSAVPGVTLREVPIGDLAANPRQPRTVFDPEAIEELAHSLREVGFLQPIVVRPTAHGYEIVAGERRWRAAQHAGLQMVPVLVRDTADDDLLRDALIENLHRVQLNALEEAAAYQQLLQEFSCTQEELARKLGKSRPAVTNSLRLLKLPPAVQRRVAAGVLSAGHARALAGVDDPGRVEELAKRAVAEGMSVRGLEEAVSLGDGEPKRRRRRRSGKPTGLEHVADELGDKLDTRVVITGSSKRGRISIDFSSPEDFARIVEALKSPDTWQ